MQSALSAQNLNLLTFFINGDELWEMVLKYLKNLTVWQKLSEVGEVLDSLDTHYTLQTTLNGPTVNFALVEKFPGAAKQKPIHFNMTFAFPKTQEGLSLKEKFEKHITTGAFPLTVPPEFIKAIEIPEFMRSIFSDAELDGFAVEIGGPAEPFSVFLKLEFICVDGEVFTLDRVQFNRTQTGTEETTLVGTLTDIPLDIILVLRIPDRSATCTFRIPEGDKSAVQVLSVLQFQRRLCQPFTLRFIHLKDGLVLFETTHSGIFATLDNHFVEFATDMAKIQQKIKRPIIIPSGKLTNDEIATVEELRTILRDGKIPIHGDINLSIKSMGVPDFIDAFGNGKEAWIRLEADETAELFGTEIPIGIVQYDAKVQMINETDVKETYAGTLDSEAPIKIKLRMIDDGNIYYKKYLDWLSE